MSNIYFYFFYLFASVTVIIYAFKTDREQLSIDWGALAKFSGFMVLLTCYRLCMYDSGIAELHRFPMKMSAFLTVFLEDAFFVMIPYYLCKKTSKKWLQYFLWAAFSLLFASGHVYQGLLIAAITGLYPYFISRKYSMKSTFMTVMACHFIYDCLTFCAAKLARLFMYV